MHSGAVASSSSSRSFAFPAPSPERRLHPAQQRASTSVLRTRRSSPLLHEIQGPSRRLSPHQVLLLTPFGGRVPIEALSNGPNGPNGPGVMARGSSSMGSSGHPTSQPRSMTTAAGAGVGSQSSSVGMGRDTDPAPSNRRSLPQFPTRLANTRHQSLVQPVNPSPLSQPLSTIPSCSEQGSESEGSQPISRDHSSAGDTEGEEGRDGLGPSEGERISMRMPKSIQTGVVPMMRSNSLPVLTLRELDAMKDKDGELGISRGMHWAWVSNEEDDGDGSTPEMAPMSRTTPSLHQFAFQDPFAPLGTMATSHTADPISTSNLNSDPSNHHNPKSTSPQYHYSPTAEARRMSEISAAGWSSTSPFSTGNSNDAEVGVEGGSRSRGESVITITPLSSQTPIAHFSPPLSTASTFNSRASMSAIEQDQPFTFGAGPGPGAGAGDENSSGHGFVGDSPKGTSMTLPAIRPRMLRYKTSPARFTGLGLDIVVKVQPPATEPSVSNGMSSTSTINGTGAGSTTYTVTSATAKERRRSSSILGTNIPSGSAAGTGDPRRSSQKSTTSTGTDNPDRRRSSGTSATSERKGVWAVVDVVDTLSSAELSIPSSSPSSSRSTNFTPYPPGQGPPQGSRRGSVYTIEHVSSRSITSSTSTAAISNSLPSRKSKGQGQGPPPAISQGFNYTTILSSADGFSLDPLAYPRRGSLAVLSQTALGPWAAKSTAAVLAGTGIGIGVGSVSGTRNGGGGGGDDLLGAPKGDWQERRGSWAEGWSKK